MCHVVLEYLFNELKQSAMRKSRGRKKVIVILIEKEHYYMYSCYMRFGATLMCGTISVYVTLVYVIHHTHMNVCIYIHICHVCYVYTQFCLFSSRLRNGEELGLPGTDYLSNSFPFS